MTNVNERRLSTTPSPSVIAPLLPPGSLRRVTETTGLEAGLNSFFRTAMNREREDPEFPEEEKVSLLGAILHSPLVRLIIVALSLYLGLSLLAPVFPGVAVALEPMNTVVSHGKAQLGIAGELWLNGTKAAYLYAVGKHPVNPGETWDQKFAEESVLEDLEDAWAIAGERARAFVRRIFGG